MKKYLAKLLAAVAVAFALLSPAKDAVAQVVSKFPLFVASQSWLDLGNGPLEVLDINGNGKLYSSAGNGIGGNGGVAGTSLTLTASAAANPPCVGCIISGPGVTSGTTITAFNGTTGITINQNATVANGSALAWGVACPTSGQPAIGSLNLSAPIELRATAGSGDTAYPMNTQARLCAYADQQAGMTLLPFTIGAW